MPTKKTSPAELQDRVLALIDQHVSLIEDEMDAYLKSKKAGISDDEESKGAKMPSFLSQNLTSYLRSLSDYQESQDEGIGKQLKALQKMSHDQILKIKADFDKRNK